MLIRILTLLTDYVSNKGLERKQLRKSNFLFLVDLNALQQDTEIIKRLCKLCTYANYT